MTYLQRTVYSVSALLLAAQFQLHAETIASGSGPTLVPAAGNYTWSPTIAAPDGTQNGTLNFEHALFFGPPVVVHVSVNGSEVGTFNADSPAFTTSSFNIGGLLVNGANSIVLSGGGVSPSDYFINSATAQYELVIPPDTGSSNSIPVSTNVVSANSRATVFHYAARANVEGISNAIGDIHLQSNQQKNSSVQKFDLKVQGLAALHDYTLVAMTATQTNAVATLKSDKQGRVTASYMDKGQGKGSGKKGLPAQLDPVTSLRAVALVDGTTVSTLR